MTSPFSDAELYGTEHPRAVDYDRISIATACYLTVVQPPEPTWWDALPPELQEAWLRLADRVLATIEQEISRELGRA